MLAVIKCMIVTLFLMFNHQIGCKIALINRISRFQKSTWESFIFKIEQDKVSISIEITPVEASDSPDPATAPPPLPPPALKPKYSESSLKTAKKVLTALKKHRKTDQPEEKAETLQVKTDSFSISLTLFS